jgi:DNA-binding NtrC family response regulator
MDPKDERIQRQIRAATGAQELRQELDALLSLLAGGDEISAAIELCRDALRRADELSLEPQDSVHYAVKLLACLRRRGTLVEASALSREVLDRVASDSLPPNVKAEALCAVAGVAVSAGELDRAAGLLAQAGTQAVASGSAECLAAYHVALGQLSLRQRRFNAAVSAFETAASLWRLLGHTARALSASGHCARAHMLAGRFGMAAEIYARAILREGLTRKARVTIAINQAICLLWLGDWDQAEALLEKAGRQAISIGLVADQARILTVKALISMRRSKLDDATDLASRALDIARLNSLVREELAALECLGETEYERGKPAEAVRFYAECMTKGESVGMSDATTEGKRRESEAWNALGEHAKARAAAEQCLAVASTNEDRYEHAVAHRPLAIALSMLGDQEGAERAFRRGVEETRALGERFELAKTLVEFACHLRDWDARALTLGAAAEYLREAREVFTALGVEKWLARVEKELAEVLHLTAGAGEEKAGAVGTGPLLARGTRHSFGSVTIVTQSREVKEIIERLERVAPSNLPVLITGESGTGKELFARALQELSGRPEERFVAVNCAALPRELHESELFGHERGSFTGATSEKPGLFEQADGGTIFLDEIGDLDAKAQGKLLRVLQDGELRRVGDLKPRRVDARVVVATNHDLQNQVAEGNFREDLYHRLNGLLVRIPSLRERQEDVEVLIAYYLEHYEHRYGRRVQVPAALLAIYRQFSWPGNVRELQQELHRMVLLSTNGAMRIEDSQVARLQAAEDSGALARSSGYDTAIEDAGRRLIVEALQQASGNKARAARILNMSRTTLLGKIQRLGIQSGAPESAD